MPRGKSDLLYSLGREKEEAEKEAEESEGKLTEVNQSKPESKTVKSKGHNDDDDDDDDITDLYDLAHYDSDEDLEGTAYRLFIFVRKLYKIVKTLQIFCAAKNTYLSRKEQFFKGAFL